MKWRLRSRVISSGSLNVGLYWTKRVTNLISSHLRTPCRLGHGTERRRDIWRRSNCRWLRSCRWPWSGESTSQNRDKEPSTTLCDSCRILAIFNDVWMDEWLLDAYKSVLFNNAYKQCAQLCTVQPRYSVLKLPQDKVALAWWNSLCVTCLSKHRSSTLRV